MLRTRYEIASVLDTIVADYNAADKMIGNGARIAEFIQDLDKAVRPVAEREFQMLLAEKRKSDPGASTIGLQEKSYYKSRSAARASISIRSRSALIFRTRA